MLPPRRIPLEDIVKLVIVVCGNRFGLHNQVYVRYIILVDHHQQAYWVDDPSEAQVTYMVHNVHPNCKKEAITAPCQFCQAVEPIS